MSDKQKVSIVTLGCAKNQVDMENLSGLLKKRGFELEAEPQNADAIVVHTCSFIEAAKRESLEAIVQAGRAKDGGKKKLIVTGCLVQQHGKEIMAELPEVDAFLGTGQLAQVPDVLLTPRPRFLDRDNPGGLLDPDAPREVPKGPTANLRLSEGCSHPCSFCVIPRLRGGLQSRPHDLILSEARSLAARGVEELVIIGQDTGDWGRDLYGEHRLPDLMKDLAAIDTVRWIRLMYMHPHSFSSRYLDVMAAHTDKITYLDMPLQHIDDTMLADMKRKLPETDVRKKVEEIRRRLPSLSLRTTFIVGYPGETDRQFERLLEFVKEGHFDYLGAFAYSQEEGTPAGIRKDQVPEDVRAARQEALMEAHFEVAHKKALSRLGSTETILIEDSEGEDVFGRSSREAPEIDAVFRLPRAAARGGRFITARITGYDAYEFQAEPA